MKNVMMGKTKSLRHDLFLENPKDSIYLDKNSGLRQLLNPHFMGMKVFGLVTYHLEETVFPKFLPQADPNLKKIRVLNPVELASMYSMLILFPETCIHQLEVNYLYISFATKI